MLRVPVKTHRKMFIINVRLGVSLTILRSHPSMIHQMILKCGDLIGRLMNESINLPMTFSSFIPCWLHCYPVLYEECILRRARVTSWCTIGERGTFTTTDKKIARIDSPAVFTIIVQRFTQREGEERRSKK